MLGKKCCNCRDYYKSCGDNPYGSCSKWVLFTAKEEVMGTTEQKIDAEIVATLESLGAARQKGDRDSVAVLSQSLENLVRCYHTIVSIGKMREVTDEI